MDQSALKTLTSGVKTCILWLMIVLSSHICASQWSRVNIIILSIKEITIISARN